MQSAESEVKQVPKLSATRTRAAGIFLVLVAIFYFGFVYPAANVPTSGYRFPFSFEATIYAVFLSLYAIHFVYRLFRRENLVPSRNKLTVHSYITIALLLAFFLMVGGSYLTGTMISTPGIYLFVSNLLGTGVVSFAVNTHLLFATLLIVFGALLVVDEGIRLVLKMTNYRNWFSKSGIWEIRLLYWVFLLAVLVQGVVGVLIAAATISPWGPYGLLPQSSLSLGDTLRLIHGPLGATVFVLFLGHVYMRIRPEYSIR